VSLLENHSSSMGEHGQEAQLKKANTRRNGEDTKCEVDLKVMGWRIDATANEIKQLCGEGR